jgi:predicted small lipoprotein YifL
MKNSLNRLIILLVVFVLSACGSRNEAPPDAGNLNASFWLSKAEQTELKNKARAGDGEAAFRLSEFFRFMRHDQKEQTKWLKLSASP